MDFCATIQSSDQAQQIVFGRFGGQAMQAAFQADSFAGLALVALLAVVVPLALSGESGSKAKAVAQGQLGAGYKYHVSSLSVSTTSRGTSVSARVTAWNDKEVRIVPVEWSE